MKVFINQRNKQKKTHFTHYTKNIERNGDVRNICDGGSFEGIGGETLQTVEEREPPLPGRHWPPHPRCHHPRRRMGLSWSHQDLELHMRYTFTLINYHPSSRNISN